MNRVNGLNQFKLTPESLAEAQAIQNAIDALKYGKHDAKAKEVEAQVRAEFRARLQAKSAGETNENS